MRLFDDIKSPLLLYLKGGLFGLLAVMAGILCLLAERRLYALGMLLVCVWASCRFYYFFFYVLDHYVGGDKNAGVLDLFRKLLKRKNELSPSATETEPSETNLFAELPESLPEEVIEKVIVSKNIRIERIVSTGQSSPEGFWYDQDEHEWVVVLRGEAELEFEGPAERRRLRAGDPLLIPAHRRHRVVWTSPDEPTVWLAVFFRD